MVKTFMLDAAIKGPEMCCTPMSLAFSPDSLEAIGLAESKHYFWTCTKHRLLLRLLRKYLTAPPRALMDVGCGTGSVLSLFRKHFPSAALTGIDIMPESIEQSRQAVSDAEWHLHDITVSAPPTNRTYDAITVLDVLEHLQHPHDALRNLRGLLSPGGIIIASVPISPSLFCVRDTYVGHFKRYRIAELRSLFRESGFRILAWSAIFSFLFIPAYLLRNVFFPLLSMRGRQIERIEVITIPGLNTLLTWIGSAEAFFATHIPLPFGTTAFCVAASE